MTPRTKAAPRRRPAVSAPDPLETLQTTIAAIAGRFGDATLPNEGAQACLLVSKLTPGNHEMARTAHALASAWAAYELAACGTVDAETADLVRAIKTYLETTTGWVFENGGWQESRRGRVDAERAEAGPPRGAPDQVEAMQATIASAARFGTFEGRLYEVLALARLLGGRLAKEESPPPPAVMMEYAQLGSLLRRVAAQTRKRYWAWQNDRPAGPVR